MKFVAVMASLFRAHHVRPALREGEELSQACGHVLDVVKDNKLGLLVQMRNPETVPLVWSRRR